MPLILITNDDGINSPGIECLKDSLSELGEVIVVAPDTQNSAVSSSLTINRPLRVSEFIKNGSFFGYAVNGTPADCVKLALSTLLDRKPDLVVSGINHGKNTSINVLYSGTVAGATEGLLFGVNSIAISHDSHALNADLISAGSFCKLLARKLLLTTNRRPILLNVNVPDIPENEVKGARLTRLSNAKWSDRYERRLDPFGNEYYWFAGEYLIAENDIDSDDGAVADGYISISPISLNLYDSLSVDNGDLTELQYVFDNFSKRFDRRNDTG